MSDQPTTPDSDAMKSRELLARAGQTAAGTVAKLFCWGVAGALGGLLSSESAGAVLDHAWDKGWSLRDVYMISAAFILIMSFFVLGFIPALSVAFGRGKAYFVVAALLLTFGFAGYLSCALSEWIVGNRLNSEANTMIGSCVGAMTGLVVGPPLARWAVKSWWR